MYHFERENLARVWSAAFSVMPLHILNIVIALLCANHVTERFGTGITPKQYWLRGADVKPIGKGLSRPKIARAPESALFRDDREETVLKHKVS